MDQGPKDQNNVPHPFLSFSGADFVQVIITKPALNRDNGYELAAIYDTILTPKRR